MLREKISKSKLKVMGVTTALVTSVPTLAFAEETTGSSSSAIDTVVSSCVSWAGDMLTSLITGAGQLIPKALPLIGIGIAITVCIKIVKKVTAKA